MSEIRAIDLFCGMGGSSWGAAKAGVTIAAAFDMWPLAKAAYRDNFPETVFYSGKLEDIKPEAIADDVGRVDLILASPECTNHSGARGKRVRSEESRNTAFQVTRFAEALKPRWIVIENVIQMKKWHRYQEFIDLLEREYHVRQFTLTASDFGVPQARRRLFIVCDREAIPPVVTPPREVLRRLASDVINGNGHYSFTPLNIPARASSTLERAQRGIQAVGPDQPFLLVYYGTDKAGGWQRLDAPLRTVTTLDRFALVRPNEAGYEMRMLQVPELKAAMGFPKKFRVEHGTRRERIHLLGNAVCPPVMKAIVRSLIRNKITVVEPALRDGRDHDRI